LRVLVNAMFWVPQAGGAARYARELLPALLAAEPATRLRVLVPADVPADVLAEPWADEVHWLRLRLPGWLHSGSCWPATLSGGGRTSYTALPTSPRRSPACRVW
jgi:hypothetical protein